MLCIWCIWSLSIGILEFLYRVVGGALILVTNACDDRMLRHVVRFTIITLLLLLSCKVWTLGHCNYRLQGDLQFLGIFKSVNLKVSEYDKKHTGYTKHIWLQLFVCWRKLDRGAYSSYPVKIYAKAECQGMMPWHLMMHYVFNFCSWVCGTVNYDPMFTLLRDYRHH